MPVEAGVVLLAGAVGLAFANMDKIKRFRGGGFEAEMRDQLQVIVAKESEPDNLDFEESQSARTFVGFGFDESISKILRALNNSNYTWRSIGGISQESRMGRKDVKSGLRWLEEKGLVVRAGVSAEKNWGLTEIGRDYANRASQVPSSDTDYK